jgi:hypothetical protein
VIRVFKKERNEQRRKQFRDIGLYTAIPMMMIVGPTLGYFLGHLAEKKWGHEPWLSAGGAVFGLVAAARQIWLILKQGAGKQ